MKERADPESEDEMLRGLQITMRGEELSNRIAERVRVHEEARDVLDARLKERAGDMPFDIRLEDNFKTIGELENERQQVQSRVTYLSLLRDNIVPGETYILDKTDLRLAELISREVADAAGIPEEKCADEQQRTAVDGLKLSISGLEVRRLINSRIDVHRRRAEHWKREQARTPEEQTVDNPLLPEHMCENEAERHEWREETLEFIRDHVDENETYRLGEADLAFGELLPEKPGWMEQEEYEERTRIGFGLERLAKNVGTMPFEFDVYRRRASGE